MVGRGRTGRRARVRPAGTQRAGQSVAPTPSPSHGEVERLRSCLHHARAPPCRPRAGTRAATGQRAPHADPTRPPRPRPGAFGFVVLAQEVETGDHWAIKFLERGNKITKVRRWAGQMGVGVGVGVGARCQRPGGTPHSCRRPLAQPPSPALRARAAQNPRRS